MGGGRLVEGENRSLADNHLEVHSLERCVRLTCLRSVSSAHFRAGNVGFHLRELQRDLAPREHIDLTVLLLLEAGHEVAVLLRDIQRKLHVKGLGPQ